MTDNEDVTNFMIKLSEVLETVRPPICTRYQALNARTDGEARRSAERQFGVFSISSTHSRLPLLAAAPNIFSHT